MLSIAAIHNLDYYSSLAEEDYYQAGGEPPGQWLSAAGLDLAGQVQDKDYQRIFAGFHPQTGEKLVQNAGDEKRRPGWDFCFSAPKSVSVVWSQADQETQKAIQEAQQKAVKAALDHLEKQAVARRGKGGVERESAKLVAAAYEHSTSRAQDPQLHTHLLVANVCQRPDGTYGSLETKKMYEHKMAAGAIYRAELAAEMQKMGFAVERESDSFRIAGSSKELEKEFSKRREEIEKSLEESGFKSAKAAAVAALDTRTKKEVRPRQELFAEWQEIGKEFEFDFDKLREAQAEEPPEMIEKEELLLKLTQRESAFKESEIWKHVAIESQGVFDASEIAQYVEDLKNSHELVKLTRENGDERWTTREMIKLEKEMVSTAESLTQRHSHSVSEASIEKAKASRTLSDQQTSALLHLAKAEQIGAVVGMAGAGKSYLLGAAREAWEAEGFQVRGAALAGKAAAGLQEDAGIKSQTIHSLLAEIQEGKTELNEKTVLVIDEAGMVGSRQTAKLINLAQETGAKLVLVGDDKQLQPVDAGGAFKAVMQKTGACELTEIRRQKDAWAVQATHNFAAGEAGRALKEYHENGMLHIHENRDETKQKMVESWHSRFSAHDQKEVLMLAATRADVADLNKLARDQIKETGKLNIGAEITTENHGKLEFCEGDRILFERNSKMIDVKNGNLGTVDTVIQTKDGFKLTVNLDDGRKINFDTDKYSHISHGYAVTTHKAQGVTVDHTFVLSGNMSSREMAYVQMSRHRHEAHMFIDKKQVENDMKQAFADLQPTEKMTSYAEELADKHDVSLPSDYKEDFWSCREFLNTYSEKELNSKEDAAQQKQQNEADQLFKDIDHAVKQMSTIRQKETTLDYEESEKPVEQEVKQEKFEITQELIDKYEIDIENDYFWSDESSMCEYLACGEPSEEFANVIKARLNQLAEEYNQEAGAGGDYDEIPLPESEPEPESELEFEDYDYDYEPPPPNRDGYTYDEDETLSPSEIMNREYLDDLRNNREIELELEIEPDL